MKKIVWALLIFVIFYFYSLGKFVVKITANNTQENNTPNLIINEVYPNPNTNEHEWIEIFNSSEEIISLSDWILMDELSSPSVIYEFDQEVIEPLSFLVIELASNKLNNSGDTVKLINNNAETIDQFTYINSEPEMSFSLTAGGEITISTPTKGEENSVNDDDTTTDPINSPTPQPTSEPTPIPTPAPTTNPETTQEYPTLLISQVLACPEDDELEWIKIQNENNETINLNNWQIKDLANNKVMLTAENSVPELGTTIISLTRNILNNSGDTVFLIDPNGKLVDQFSYEGCGNEEVINTSGFTTSTSSNDSTDPNSNTNNQTTENSKDSTTNNENLNTNIIKNTAITNLKKINSLLKIINPDKSSTSNKENYLSKQIVINHKDLPKTAVISVIIGGMIISSSGLFFNTQKSTNNQSTNEKN